MEDRRIEAIASIAHAANKAYCEVLGDHSHAPWTTAPAFQKEGLIKGVERCLDALERGEVVAGEDMHRAWMDHKLDEGWRYGPDKSTEEKTHPCIVEYADLPIEQQVKDSLFIAIIEALWGKDFDGGST